MIAISIVSCSNVFPCKDIVEWKARQAQRTLRHTKRCAKTHANKHQRVKRDAHFRNRGRVCTQPARKGVSRQTTGVVQVVKKLLAKTEPDQWSWGPTTTLTTRNFDHDLELLNTTTPLFLSILWWSPPGGDCGTRVCPWRVHNNWYQHTEIDRQRRAPVGMVGQYCFQGNYTYTKCLGYWRKRLSKVNHRNEFLVLIGCTIERFNPEVQPQGHNWRSSDKSLLVGWLISIVLRPNQAKIGPTGHQFSLRELELGEGRLPVWIVLARV